VLDPDNSATSSDIYSEYFLVFLMSGGDNSQDLFLRIDRTTIQEMHEEQEVD
jgi:hypothetical protein